MSPENNENAKPDMTTPDERVGDDEPRITDDAQEPRPSSPTSVPPTILEIITEKCQDAVLAVKSVAHVAEDKTKAVGEVVSDATHRATERLKEANDADLGPYASCGTNVPSDFDPIGAMDLEAMSKSPGKAERK